MKISSAYFLMPLLALAGASCASDNHEPESPATVRAAWVSLDISMGSETRALDDIDDPNDVTSRIGRVNVYLTEGTDGNEVIKAVGIGDLNTKKFPNASDKTKMNIKASIDAASPIEEGKTYRLRVVANARMLNPLSAASVKGTASEHYNVKWSYASSEFSGMARKGLPLDGMPMSAIGSDFATVTIESGKGTEDAPFKAEGSVTLTRMMSAIDYNPGDKGNEYDVEKQNIKVRFLTMQPVNVVKDTYIMQRTLSTPAGLIQTPSSTTLYGNLPDAAYTAPVAALQEVTSPAYTMPETDNENICYVTENVPGKGDLTLKNATGVIFTAMLVYDPSSTPSDIAGYIGGATHPTLVYFDDGTYQSGLMKYDADKHKGADWHLVKWETVTVKDKTTNEDKKVEGYIVRYLKTIRHGGITPDKKGTSTEPESPAIDGKIGDMEYATVRGFRYVMHIAGVTTLPHPYHPDYTPEDGKGDIDIEVKVPEKWIYDRRLEQLNNF